MGDLTLYKTSQEFESLIELLDRDVLEDFEADALKKRLSNAIKVQGNDIIKYYINEMADIEVLKREIKRLQTMKSAREARLETFKERLTENMRALQCNKIPTPYGNITLALDGKVQSVEISKDIDLEKIPEEYLSIKKDINKTNLKKALQEGKSFEGIELISKPAKVAFRLGQDSKDYISDNIIEE